jgi:hypothetical protein
MSASFPLTQDEREELLRRSWMASDGLWFYQTAQALGLDGANSANSEVVREFARQEMRRLMQVLGVDKVETAAQYHELFRIASELYLGSLFGSDESLDGDVHDIEVKTCFAYMGVKRAGIDKDYHCGPGERLTGWLQGMGLAATITPEVGLCQMAHTGRCHYQVKIDASATL